jgi:hypothetical protein
MPYIVHDGQWQCGIRPTAPSMAHPGRRVMPNGPVGRKLRHFKCIGKASAYIPCNPGISLGSQGLKLCPPTGCAGVLYITCRGCLSRYIAALVPLLYVLTASCSRTADIRAPCGQRQLGAYLAGRPFPGSQGQTGRCHRTHRTALLRGARGCVGLAGHQWTSPRPLVAGA